MFFYDEKKYGLGNVLQSTFAQLRTNIGLGRDKG